VSHRRNPLAAALEGDIADFLGEADEDMCVGKVMAKICYEAYHECPLCDCTAITRGAAHPMVICPSCGLEMMMSARKDS
jgi:hypothetical protein